MWSKIPSVLHTIIDVSIKTAHTWDDVNLSFISRYIRTSCTGLHVQHNHRIPDYINNHTHKKCRQCGACNTLQELIRTYSSGRQAIRKCKHCHISEHGRKYKKRNKKKCVYFSFSPLNIFPHLEPSTIVTSYFINWYL